MIDSPTATITTRPSDPTEWRMGSLVKNYSAESLLGKVWPFNRGRAFAEDTWVISPAKNLHSRPAAGSKKGGKGGKKGGGGSEKWFGTMMYGVALGPLKLLHNFKVDDVSVWKNIDGITTSANWTSVTTSRGVIHISNGSWESQPHPLYADGPGYRGRIVVILEDYELGTDRTSEPSVIVEGTYGDEAEDGLYSSARVIQELMTDPKIGLAAKADVIDVSGLLALQTRMGSFAVTEEKTIQSLIDDWFPLAWCRGRFAGRKVVVDQIFNSPDWDTVPEITEEIALEPIVCDAETPEESVSGVGVKWSMLYDGDDGDSEEGCYDEYAEARDPVVGAFGGKFVTVQADEIITPSVANDFALTKLHALAVRKSTGSASIFKDQFALAATAINSPIKVQIRGQWLRARVTGRKIYAAENRLDLDFDTDTTASIHDSASKGWITPTFSRLLPVDPRAVMLFEVPRPLAEQTAVGILCARGATHVNRFAIVHSVDGGVNFDYAGVSTAFAVFGHLESDLSISGGTLTMQDVDVDAGIYESVSSAEAAADTLLAFVGGPADYEILSVNTITQDGSGYITLSGLRGRIGTARRVHESGESVFLIRRKILPIIPVDEPATVVNTAADPAAGVAHYFRLPQAVVSKIQDSDACEDHIVSINGAYRRPIAPEAVSLDGGHYAASDMRYRVTPVLWRGEGYSAADFYEQADVSIVPVVVVGDDRTVLPSRAWGEVVVGGAEMAAALAGTISADFTIEFFAYTGGRHSAAGTNFRLTRDYIVQSAPLGGPAGVPGGGNLDPVDIDGVGLAGSVAACLGGNVVGRIVVPGLSGRVSDAPGGDLKGQGQIDEVPIVGDAAACIDGQSVRGSNIKLSAIIGAYPTAGGGDLMELTMPAAENLIWELDSTDANTSGSYLVWPTTSGNLQFTRQSGAPALSSEQVNGVSPVQFTLDKMYNSSPGLPTGAAPWSISTLLKLPTGATGMVWSFGIQRMSLYVYPSAGTWGVVVYVRPYYFYGSTPAASDDWQLITVTYDGSTVRVYKGTQVVCTHDRVLANSASTMYLGSWVFTDRWATNLSILRLLTYDKTLSDLEISQICTVLGAEYNLNLT